MHHLVDHLVERRTINAVTSECLHQHSFEEYAKGLAATVRIVSVQSPNAQCDQLL